MSLTSVPIDEKNKMTAIIFAITVILFTLYSLLQIETFKLFFV